MTFENYVDDMDRRKAYKCYCLQNLRLITHQLLRSPAQQVFVKLSRFDNPHSRYVAGPIYSVSQVLVWPRLPNRRGSKSFSLRF